MTGRTLAEVAAEHAQRTRRASGVPRIPTDSQALRRTAQILRAAERPGRGGDRG